MRGAPRVAFLFTGGDVAHAHAQLVPMHEMTSCRCVVEEHLTFRPMPAASAEELPGSAAALRSASGQA